MIYFTSHLLKDTWLNLVAITRNASMKLFVYISFHTVQAMPEYEFP